MSDSKYVKHVAYEDANKDWRDWGSYHQCNKCGRVPNLQPPSVSYCTSPSHGCGGDMVMVIVGKKAKETP